MSTNVYECLFLLDANKYAKDPGAVSGKLDELVKELGGEILASRLWAEQKLAYPVNGQRKGTYWLSYFRLDGTKLDELNRACQLNGDILRSLVLKVEPRLVDAMVSHALGQSTSAEPAEAETTEEAPTEAPEPVGAAEAATDEAS